MNNSSKVLALKYRPQSFNDLIGQEEIVQTIYNAIKSNKTPNAYLFTGIRGIGKTTIARIVAKSLNCVNGVDQLCKKDYCEHCKSITSSNHIDVLEMDAASKTGVDDVRDLIEFSRYGPTSAKYKIFIIDEVHMLSKQAFNALLKTLEEPPEYLKFIFATTEIKKIPITVLSRCQRFDLSRIRSNELFKFINQVKDQENGNITEDAIKLIVKISEGSVRDALSLLDRALLSQDKNEELNLEKAQKIFGYFDKSYLINLIKCIFEGKEDEVIKNYRHIYDQGVEPKIFLNDFLELLYYFKNISYLKLEGTHFSLNDENFEKIKVISEGVSQKTLLLFWQFTIKTLNEIEIVSNQSLSIEMFLVRIMYLIDIEKKNIKNDDREQYFDKKILKDVKEKKIKPIDQNQEIKSQTVSQIKNIYQKETSRSKSEIIEKEKLVKINDFEQLIDICYKKKEIKLKYELETNVNLVSFENKKIEISFNENLDKNFVKDLSTKLFEWTNSRWIITFSQKVGANTKKQENKNKKLQLVSLVKDSENYKKIIAFFPDAELINIETLDKKDE